MHLQFLVVIDEFIVRYSATFSYEVHQSRSHSLSVSKLFLILGAS